MPRAVPFSVETASCRLPGTDSICSKKVLEFEEKVVRLKEWERKNFLWRGKKVVYERVAGRM